MSIVFYGLGETGQKWKYYANSCGCSIIFEAERLAGVPPRAGYRVSVEDCRKDAVLLAKLDDEQIDLLRRHAMVSDCVLPGRSLVPAVREWQGFLETCGGYVTDQEWIPAPERTHEWQDWRKRDDV